MKHKRKVHMVYILAVKSEPTAGLCLSFLENYLQCVSNKAKVQRMNYILHDKLRFQVGHRFCPFPISTMTISVPDNLVAGHYP